MSQTWLIGAGIAVILMLLMFAIISQRLEAARQAKIRRARKLSAHIRRMWSLLVELPQDFLTRELQLYLVQALGRAMNEYAALGHGGEIKRQQAKLLELHKQIQARPAGQHELPRFPNAKAAREARARLRQMQLAVKDMHAGRELDRSAAQKFVARISELNGETMLQLYIDEARSATRKFNTDLALHHLNTCRGELSRINPEGQWTARLQQLDQMIASVQQHGGLTPEEGQELAQLKQTAPAEESQAPSELQRGLEELQAEDQAWKKKADYD